MLLIYTAYYAIIFIGTSQNKNMKSSESHTRVEPPNEPEYTTSHKRFGENSRQRTELKSVFDPLAHTIASRIDTALSVHSHEIRETLQDIPHYTIPYTAPVHEIPPGYLDPTMPLLPDPRLDELQDNPNDNDEFPTERAFRELNERYATHLEQSGTAYEKSIKQQLIDMAENFYEHHYSHEFYDKFDTTAWKQYETAYASARANGDEATLLDHNRTRGRNGHNQYKAPAQYNDFLLTHARTQTHSMFDNIAMPVGAYGEEFAKNISLATLFIIESVESAAPAELHTATLEHQSVLETHTARGAEERDGANDRSTMLTLQEGALSIMQTIALLTADKVPGYDDPGQLLRDIVDQGLIEKVTRMMPLGLVGPLALKGNYFPNPLQAQDGLLALSSEFTAWLHEAHTQYWQGLLAEKTHTAETGYGLTCPASSKGGGIRALSDTLTHIYDML